MLRSSIIVSYHKKFFLLKSNYLYPLQVGRSLRREECKDGILSNGEQSWLEDNMPGDDTGDNISNKNRFYCELTGMYWAWRHYDSLGFPEFIGFMHYRRQFCFSEEKLIQILSTKGKSSAIEGDLIFTGPIENFSPDELSELFADNLIESALTDVDLIGPRIHTENTQYEKFKQRTDLMVFSDLTKTLEIIERDYSSYLPLVQQALHTKDNYLFNMFIMRWPLFTECCDFIFGVLFKLEQEIKDDLMSRNLNQRRVFGYISEVLFTAFFIKMQQEGKRIKNLKIIYETEYRNDDSYKHKFVVSELPDFIKSAVEKIKALKTPQSRIYIYGAGDLGEKLLFALSEQKLTVAGMFDRQGSRRFGFEVQTFSKDKVTSDDLIVIASQAYATEIEVRIRQVLAGKKVQLVRL